MNILQIGTETGDDPVYNFCSKNASKLRKVVLVEPCEAALEVAKKRYASIPCCDFVNAAVIDTDSDSVKIFLPEGKNFSQHCSLSEEHVLLHRHKKVVGRSVPAVRVNTLLSRFDGPIDRLYIDTEGFDGKIIRDIDFSLFDIKYIQFEFLHLERTHRPGKEKEKITSLLENAGYDVQQVAEYDLGATKKAK